MMYDSYSPANLRSVLMNYTTGCKDINDPLFAAANCLIKPYIKLGVLSKQPDEDASTDITKAIEIVCSVPDCGQMFHATADYESHYNNVHRYSCAQCKKTMPNAHLLDLHVSEVHDSYFAVLAEKKAMYACFLEECPVKSTTNAERKDHCIKEHKFPHNFRFDNPVKQKKIAKQHTSPDAKGDNMETDDIVEEMERVCLADNARKPKHIQFGHGTVKTFKAVPAAVNVRVKPNKKGRSISNNDDVMRD